MDADFYKKAAEVEATHWWFEGRRQLFLRTLRDIGVTDVSAILDIGCSTGNNMRMLKSAGFSNYMGLDYSAIAVEFCRSAGLGNVEQGDALHLPFEDDTFELALLTDVIEHLDDDSAAIAEACRVVKPGGHVLVTVPAFPSLWSVTDVNAHHKRRYRQNNLLQTITSSGLAIDRFYHFNFLLFLPIWLFRKINNAAGMAVKDELNANNAVLNRVLNSIFALDTWLAERIRPNFGVSILALGRVPTKSA
ncbi:MAG: class I SAM-dependent methyltransferase [Rhodospirillales bacterium]